MFNRALPASVEQSEERSEIVATTGGFACVPPDVVGVPFPTAAYDQNLFYAAAGYLLGLAMTMVNSRSRVSVSVSVGVRVCMMTFMCCMIECYVLPFYKIPTL